MHLWQQNEKSRDPLYIEGSRLRNSVFLHFHDNGQDHRTTTRLFVQITP